MIQCVTADTFFYSPQLGVNGHFLAEALNTNPQRTKETILSPLICDVISVNVVKTERRPHSHLNWSDRILRSVECEEREREKNEMERDRVSRSGQ